MRCERGYTLTEALIVVVLLIVVLGGTLSMLDTTAHIAPEENERAHAIREAQVGLATMVRELRQARSVEAHSATSMTVRTPVAGTPTRVRWDCAAGSQSKSGLNACERVQYDGAGQAVSTTYPLDRLIEPEVFEYTLGADGDVEYVRARIRVPASGERETGVGHAIVLDDGFFLRNLAR